MGEIPLETIYVDCFPAETQSNFDYYDDDGNSYDYEGGSFFRQTFSLQEGSGWTHATIGTAEGSHDAETQYYLFRIHGRSGASVYSNASVLPKFSSASSLLSATSEGWATVTDRFGPATWVKVFAGAPRDLYVLGGTTPDAPAPAPAKTRYEAEQGSTNASISQKENASSYAYVGGLDAGGKYVALNVAVLHSGQYALTIGYANGWGNTAKRSLYVNGADLQDVSFPATGSWENFVYRAPLTVSLQAGNNQIKLQRDWWDGWWGSVGTIDLDFIEVTPAY